MSVEAPAPPVEQLQDPEALFAAETVEAPALPEQLPPDPETLFAAADNVEVIGFEKEAAAVGEPSGYRIARLDERVVIQRPGQEAGLFNDLLPFVRDERKVLERFGFHMSRKEDGFYLVAPNADKLNELRSEVPEEAGVNTGTFVSVASHLKPREYLEFFARREIPVAEEDPEFMLHDVLGHTLGFAVMNKEIFDFIVEKAQAALESGDPREIGRVTGFIDIFSATFRVRAGHMSRRDLSEQYASHGVLLPLFAGAKGKKHAAKQAETMQALDEWAA